MMGWPAPGKVNVPFRASIAASVAAHVAYVTKAQPVYENGGGGGGGGRHASSTDTKVSVVLEELHDRRWSCRLSGERGGGGCWPAPGKVKVPLRASIAASVAAHVAHVTANKHSA
jgi:hypothetical protein